MRRCDQFKVSEATKLRMHGVLFHHPWHEFRASMGGFLWSRVMRHIRRLARVRDHDSK